MLLAVWLIIGGAAIGAGNDAIGDNARMPDPLAGLYRRCVRHDRQDAVLDEEVSCES